MRKLQRAAVAAALAAGVLRRPSHHRLVPATECARPCWRQPHSHPPIWAATCSLPQPPTERQNKVIGVAAGVPEPLKPSATLGLDLTAWQE